ncbi:MAG: hypothetical protein H6873_05620 [Hyphomicrobiaceae bacterium]|nr:hypothetical protein [Hyphomicrobiaceae bacterium]
MSNSEELTVIVGRAINPPHALWLTEQQYEARRHVIRREDKPKTKGGKSNLRIRAELTAPTFFKAGEVVVVEGGIEGDRGLEIMFGSAEPKAELSPQRRRDGRDAAREALPAAKERAAKATEAVDAAAKALKDAADDAAKAAAQTSLDSANAEFRQANAALADLEERAQ